MTFIEQLSLTGSVRAAASAKGVSHQSAYRARRSCRHLRVAWDAALVLARVHVADVMGCRALDGVEEKVFYKGEEVGSRTRYSDRLLLAHPGRLDKLVESPEAAVRGGEILAEGTPGQVVKVERSFTGVYFAPLLAR